MVPLYETCRQPFAVPDFKETFAPDGITSRTFALVLGSARRFSAAVVVAEFGSYTGPLGGGVPFVRST